MKLNKADIQISKDVFKAYAASEEGKTQSWVSNQALSILAFNSKNRSEYLQNIHALVTSAICTMVKVGKLKVIE